MYKKYDWESDDLSGQYSKGDDVTWKTWGLHLAAGSVQRRCSLFVIVNKEAAACRIRRNIGVPIATSLRRRRPFIPIRRTLKPITVRHFGSLFHPLKHPPPTYEYSWGHAVFETIDVWNATWIVFSRSQDGSVRVDIGKISGIQCCPTCLIPRATEEIIIRGRTSELKHAVYLPDSLDLTRCLSILFWTSASE